MTLGDETYDVRGLASRLMVKPHTIYTWLSKEKSDPTVSKLPPHYRVGNRARWTRESVDAWIEAQQQKSA